MAVGFSELVQHLKSCYALKFIFFVRNSSRLNTYSFIRYWSYFSGFLSRHITARDAFGNLTEAAWLKSARKDHFTAVDLNNVTRV